MVDVSHLSKQLGAFKIIHHYPSVEMLQFYLLGQHNILFNNDEDLDDVADRAQHSISMLMG